MAAPVTAGVRTRWARTLTSPVVPLGLLAVLAGGLLAAGRELPALCAVAAVAGVALSGST